MYHFFRTEKPLLNMITAFERVENINIIRTICQEEKSVA